MGSLFLQNGNSRGFLYTSAGFQQLPTLGVDRSAAYALNPGGHGWLPGGVSADTLIAGYATAPDGRRHAVRWVDGVIKDLGTQGSGESIAYDIADNGVAVGAFSTGSGWRAFLYSDNWLAIGGTPLRVDLNSRIDSAAGWVLNEARAISMNSDSPRWHVAGWGRHNGQERAFLLTDIEVTNYQLLADQRADGWHVTGGQPVTVEVTVNLPAPFPIDVPLENGHGSSHPPNPAATVPTTVRVPAGATRGTATITTLAVTSAVDGWIWVHSQANFASYGRRLWVDPIGLQSLTLAPTSVRGGVRGSGRVTLMHPAAPGDIEVLLSSNDPSAARPAVSRVTIPRGSTSTIFSIDTFPVAGVRAVAIDAQANNGTTSLKASLTVTP